jgi:hypothetical protein
MKKLLKPLKPLIYSFLQSDQGKRLIISVLKAAAKQTNNSLDDQAVEFIETRLFPNKTTSLQ